MKIQKNPANPCLNIIKVGGAVVEDDNALQALIASFAALGGRRVLVHGGGRTATRLADALGIETRMVGGRRVTDADTLRVVTMVYGGLVNKRVVAALQAAGVNAIGLTGADMDVIRAHRREVVRTMGHDGQPLDIDYGFVGDIDRADGEALARLIDAGLTPVVAPLAHDGRGQLLNVNADTMASAAATALAPRYDVTLTYCFERPGVLADPDDDTSVISRITPADFTRLVAAGVVSGGMIPKLHNALEAIRQGVQRVVITSAADLQGRCGTVVTA